MVGLPVGIVADLAGRGCFGLTWLLFRYVQCVVTRGRRRHLQVASTACMIWCGSLQVVEQLLNWILFIPDLESGGENWSSLRFLFHVHIYISLPLWIFGAINEIHIYMNLNYSTEDPERWFYLFRSCVGWCFLDLADCPISEETLRSDSCVRARVIRWGWYDSQGLVGDCTLGGIQSKG